jgi:hypothetical protein
MNRDEAKKLAEKATVEEIKQMFFHAQKEIMDWTIRARINKQMSKGLAFNLLSKGIEEKQLLHVLAKTNMIWEFGEYLPGYTKPKKEKRKLPKISHQDPIFLKQDNEAKL